MTEIIITVALQRDTENGDVHCLSLPVTEEVAAQVLNEQEACELLSDGGALAELLNAYAILCGYQCAWFICAEGKADQDDERIEETPKQRSETTCKECVHFEACAAFWYSDYDCCDNIEQSKQKHANNKSCDLFKPSSAVVEVVRCKDCKHRYEPIHCSLWYARVDDAEYFVENGEDFYCPWGERRQ